MSNINTTMYDQYKKSAKSDSKVLIFYLLMYWYQIKQKLSVNKNECREITESVVNDLGKIGNGIKFDEDLYKECLTQVDYWGTKKITKQYITNLVTKMVTSKIEWSFQTIFKIVLNFLFIALPIHTLQHLW